VCSVIRYPFRNVHVQTAPGSFVNGESSIR
jgi:hypothetical protein